jgi:cell wall-associated NlpC family hydrolase
MVAVLPAVPAPAAPSASDLQRQVDAAWQKLEPVIEQYNKVRSELAANQKKSQALRQKIEPLRETVQRAQARVEEIAAGYYRRGGALATVNAVLSGGSPTMVTDQLAMLEQVASSERREITSLVAQQSTYDAEKKTVDALIVAQERQRADLAARKQTIEAEVKKLEALHRQIAAAEASAAAKAAAEAAAARAAAAAATADRTSPIVSSSPLFIGGQCPAVPSISNGGIAAKTACRQIGKPYEWAANGPDTFDCSGLTQYAWASVGVSLTHFTGAQWNEGTPVAKADLRTGDLVFFYSDLHHMGIYVGNGLIVHAPHTGDVVRMAVLANMPYAGARRPG